MKKTITSTCIFLFAIVCIAGIACEALAADTGQSWRPTYDMVMRWVNFIILAFLIVKFARAPLKDFLSGQKEKLAKDIKRNEEEKEAAEREVKEILETLKESDTRCAAIKERIVEQGEKRKQQIIQEAGEQSRQMLADAKKRIDTQILQAKESFRSELVDAAADLAMKRLPGLITEKDNQSFIRRFLAEAGK